MWTQIGDWFLSRSSPNFTPTERAKARFSLLIFPYFFVLAGFDCLLAFLGSVDNSALECFVLQGTLMLVMAGLVRVTGRHRLLLAVHLFLTLLIESWAALNNGWTFDPMLLQLVSRVIFTAVFLGAAWARSFAVLNTLVCLFVFQQNTTQGDVLPEGMALHIASFAMIARALAAVALTSFASRLYENELLTQSEELDASRRLAFRAARYNRLGHMLGELNHHINNPLAILEASFYRLRNTKGPPRLDFERELLLQPIDNSMARIRYIIHELKLISHHEQSESEQAQTVRSICKNILLMTEESRQKNQIQIQFIDLTQNTQFYCRLHQLVRILSAIVVNACEAGSHMRGLHIAVTIGIKDSQIEFQVADSGPGVPRELESKLFEPFFTTKPTHSHAGLSLATSRAMIEEMGGSLNYAPQVQGASFRLSLPWKTGEAAA